MEETNKTRIREFYVQFQASRTDLSSRLEALKTAGKPGAEELNALTTDVAKLRKDLVDATSFLPTYDQRQYEQTLKSLELSLEELRLASAPKPKFAFKRKTPKATPTAGQTAPPAETPEQNTSVAIPPQSSNLSLSGHSWKYLDRSSLPTLESSSDLTISDLDHCIVNLLPPSNSDPTNSAQTCTFTALHVRNLSGTVLLLPSINGSALLHDLRHCTIALGCHQFRMHTSRNVDVYLSIESNPIIEHCSAIRFAEYPSTIPGSVNDLIPILRETSKHLAVQDFSHIRATPSPNWSALPLGKGLHKHNWASILEEHREESAESIDIKLERLLPEI